MISRNKISIKKIALLLIFFTSSYAVGAVVTSNSAIIASNNHRNSIEAQELYANSMLISSKKEVVIKGVMTCRYDYHSIPGPGAYIVDGCDGHESISHFFRRNKIDKKDQIIYVIYDESHSQFIIYYGEKNE